METNYYTTISRMPLEIIKLIRVYQWPKNFFVFLPLFFSGKILAFENFKKVLWVFLAFCLVASAVYIINDLFDIKSDKKHPEKRFRPIASGAISIPYAIILCGGLLSFSITIALSQFNTLILFFLLGYFLLNILYSLRLKKIAIVDLMVIAIGFILRVFVGGVSIDTALSKWLVLMTFLLALFLGFAKRRDDLLILEEKGKAMRTSLNGYSLSFVNHSMVFISSIIVVCYFMYSISEDVMQRLGNEYFYITSFFVITGMLRYFQITYVENNSGSPSKILLTDEFTIINLLLWGLSVSYFIYF
ncbi:UbiA prenyltransferase family protein [Sporocytophaga myxococcoides]|uniref:UbiA prenyltransferase family protein n=1 Tax=Sporocytophaga myxococcoides TaxID=153721 RepID=UPI0004111789|nr:UbiA prenyltransferase family protein [Sporocytophaga myxococcoides]